ncbi:MAG TPA: methyltransferase domain-containing protein [Rhizomicrobium sp.]|nr:methyltransferase domain-containing protein [Rhizomicrobium sp.]
MRPDGLEAAREAALLDPLGAEAALGHGLALKAAARIAEAIGELQRALRLDPELAEARLALGEAWLEAGEPDRALQALERLEPDERVLGAMARARAIKDRARSDPGYVRHLFDQFAQTYEATMTGALAYAAPKDLRRLYDFFPRGRAGLDILDLGCGTGLCGAAFRDLARRLDGVDLSPAMIAHARRRGIYDSLAVDDIETYLSREGPDYDLILAADAFVYLGDLAPVFSGAARRMKKGGALIFTVERLEGQGFELGPKRRWRHSEDYLRRTAAEEGLDPIGIVSCTPRYEANAPVDGLAIALTHLTGQP